MTRARRQIDGSQLRRALGRLLAGTLFAIASTAIVVVPLAAFRLQTDQYVAAAGGALLFGDTPWGQPL
jgi:hypothetical protein